MKYDLFAAFYEKASDEKPLYRCPLGVVNALRFHYLADKGFSISKDSTPGYLDYVKETDMDGLRKWIKKGYYSEVMDVLHCGKRFEKIILQAEELDILDDDGTIPARGVTISGCFVEFYCTEPDSPVTFIDSDSNGTNVHTQSFSIPLKKLKDYFGVLTQMEVWEQMNALGSSRHWSLDELKKCFIQ